MKKVFKGFLVSVLVASLFSTQASARTLTSSDVWMKVNDSNYTCAEGMCIDDKDNVYVAKLMKITGNSVTIYKYNKNKTLVKSAVFSASIMGHANDMTYCSRNEKIYIATCSDSDYSVIEIDKNLKIINKYKASKFSKLGGRATGIAYSAKNDLFFLKRGDNVCAYEISHTAINFVSDTTISKGKYTSYVYQGIAVDDKYMYVPLSSQDSINSVIKVFNIKKNNGKYEFTNHQLLSHNDPSMAYFEIESIDFGSDNYMKFMINGGYSMNDSYDQIYRISK